MSDNAEKIAKLRKEADELEAADKAFRELPDEYKLAITLHSTLCHWNHADGCGWYYEINKGIDDWSGQAHQPYLMRARAVLTYCNKRNITVDDITNILKLAER